MKTLPLFTACILFTMMAANAQPFNVEVQPQDNPTLLGKINKEALSGPHYASWFTKNYDTYTPKSETVKALKPLLAEYTITAFLGTWCGDSKAEIPKFYKVLEAVDFPLERLTTIALSRDRDTYKQSPGGEEEGLSIHRVPTFIIYKDGKEVNRIVEHPIVSVEADLLQLLKGSYTPNYESVIVVSEALAATDLKTFRRKSKKLLPKLKKVTKNMYELNTYTNVLFFAEKREKAIAVAELNAKLFPEEVGVYLNLGNKLAQMDKIEEARNFFNKALTIEPENTKAKAALEAIKG